MPVAKKKKPKEEKVNNKVDINPELTEAPLTLAQRRKRAFAIKRAMPKILRGRRLAKHRMANRDKLTIRARRRAVQLLRKKIAGKKGANYQSLSPGEKMNIDRQLQKRKGAIGKIAKRLLVKVTRDERARLKSAVSSGDNNNS